MLLNDPIWQKQLQKNGYVVIPFLSDAEIKDLNQFYREVHNNNAPPDFIDGIHMTTWCSDLVYKQKISDHLKQAFTSSVNKTFKDCRSLNHVFIVKQSGKHTTFKVHQDWNVVDENKYESMNVWIPLHDVDENSGALWVLPGSHKIKRKIRGAGYLFPDYSEYFNELEKKSVSVKLKAGEAIVFYHSVIHGSPSNQAVADRKAACFSVIPKNAPLCIYFQPDAGAPLEEYQPNDNFVYQYDYLRTESRTKRPAEKPVNLFKPFINKKVELKELHPFLNPKRGILSFFRR